MDEDKPFHNGSNDPARSSGIVLEEAAAWFAQRLENGGAEDLPRQFAAWLAADARHPPAYAEVARSWAGAGVLMPAPASPLARPVSRRGFGRIAAGVGAGALAAGGAWLLVPDHPFADHRTVKGERGSATLPDGTVVELSTATALSHHFDGATRRVTLHAGEAYFDVASDPARPFIVEAASGRTSALGTAFAVAHDGDGAVVTVAQHAVSVAHGDAIIRLDAGRRARYAAGRIENSAPVDPAVALSWRGGRLVFVAVALRDVVAAIDRWRPGRTLLMDESMADRQITVILDARRSDAMIEALDRVLPLKVIPATRFLTLIYPATTAP